MNGKTAKLLNRYALAKGVNSRDLKRQWMSMNARERFQRRQKLILELKGK